MTYKSYYKECFQGLDYNRLPTTPVANNPNHLGQPQGWRQVHAELIHFGEIIENSGKNAAAKEFKRKRELEQKKVNEERQAAQEKITAAATLKAHQEKQAALKIIEERNKIAEERKAMEQKAVDAALKAEQEKQATLKIIEERIKMFEEQAKQEEDELKLMMDLENIELEGKDDYETELKRREVEAMAKVAEARAKKEKLRGIKSKNRKTTTSTSEYNSYDENIDDSSADPVKWSKEKCEKFSKLWSE